VTARHEGAALTEDEVIAQCQGILIAGHETTTALIANGMLALLHDSEAWHLLRDHPELSESAIEELLRYESPFQFHRANSARRSLYRWTTHTSWRARRPLAGCGEPRSSPFRIQTRSISPGRRIGTWHSEEEGIIVLEQHLPVLKDKLPSTRSCSG